MTCQAKDNLELFYKTVKKSNIAIDSKFKPNEKSATFTFGNFTQLAQVIHDIAVQVAVTRPEVTAFEPVPKLEDFEEGEASQGIYDNVYYNQRREMATKSDISTRSAEYYESNIAYQGNPDNPVSELRAVCKRKSELRPSLKTYLVPG